LIRVTTVKGSLRALADGAARVLMQAMRRQANGGTTYPVDQENTSG
jgi:hypothetical protein